MKKILSLVVLVVLSFTLAACSSEEVQHCFMSNGVDGDWVDIYSEDGNFIKVVYSNGLVYDVEDHREEYGYTDGYITLDMFEADVWNGEVIFFTACEWE